MFRTLKTLLGATLGKELEAAKVFNADPSSGKSSARAARMEKLEVATAPAWPRPPGR